jgi:hypothetical protein
MHTHKHHHHHQAVRRQGRAFRRLLGEEDPAALQRLRTAQALLER